MAVCLATAEPKSGQRRESKLAVRVVTETPDPSKRDGAAADRATSQSPGQARAVFIEPELTGPNAAGKADDRTGAANGGSSAPVEPVELPRLAMIGQPSASGSTSPAVADGSPRGVETESGFPATGSR